MVRNKRVNKRVDTAMKFCQLFPGLQKSCQIHLLEHQT